MLAFVTGGTGLLGSNLVRQLLHDGHTVRVLARSKEKASLQLADLDESARERYSIVVGDLSDVSAFAASLEGVDIVFHTAAYFREYYQPGDHWTELERLNVRATQAVIESAAEVGVPAFLHVSTLGVIGMKPGGEPGDESTPPSAAQLGNLYFRSKYAADEVIDELEAKSDIRIVTVHPGWMFGPGDAAPTSAGALVIQFLRREIPGVPPGGMNVADVRDVSIGAIRAAERGGAGSHFILGGPYVSVKEIFASLARVSGVPSPRIVLPPRVLESVAWLGEKLAVLRRRPARISLEGVRMFQLEMRVSSARAEQELGVTFRPLEETLRDTIEWFRSHGMLSDLHYRSA
ncbi:MAG TPA: SDR family oxidoreductase [Gemmatimonadaceae bacterium]|nr:SDR family oxidoreductase [Gemmatimonadaceae bacterium]